MPQGERSTAHVFGWATLLLTAVSALGTVIGVWVAVAAAEPIRPGITIKVVVVVSAAVIVLLNVLAIYLNLKDAHRAKELRGELDAVKRQALSPRDEVDPKERELFERFFGPRASPKKDGYPAVFLRAKTPRWSDEKTTPNKPDGTKFDCKTLNEIAERERPNNVELPNRPPESKGTFPKGLFHIVPFEDLEAVRIIDRLFSKYGTNLYMMLDPFDTNITKEPLKEGCLSIGLGYNNVTTTLMKKSHLFEISYPNGSDDFCLRKFDDPNQPDGRSELIEIPKSSDWDYALFARVLLEAGRGNRPIPYIVCAGRTAGATVVTCTYLANHWEEIAEKFRTAGNFPDSLDQYHMATVFRYELGPEQVKPNWEPSFLRFAR
ncbi:MAG: hypothetical protein ABSD98_02760 [Candidatus Korobacteraceae bacterium]|jgi:hypothetical protein